MTIHGIYRVCIIFMLSSIENEHSAVQELFDSQSSFLLAAFFFI